MCIRDSPPFIVTTSLFTKISRSIIELPAMLLIFLCDSRETNYLYVYTQGHLNMKLCQFLIATVSIPSKSLVWQYSYMGGNIKYWEICVSWLTKLKHNNSFSCRSEAHRSYIIIIQHCVLHVEVIHEKLNIEILKVCVNLFLKNI